MQRKMRAKGKKRSIIGIHMITFILILAVNEM